MKAATVFKYEGCDQWSIQVDSFEIPFSYKEELSDAVEELAACVGVKVEELQVSFSEEWYE